MPVKLSHSSKELYLKSPKAWYLHYKKYIRSEVAGSALFFGSKIEIGIDALLEGKSLLEAQNLFLDDFEEVQINGEWISLKDLNKIEYSKSDLDEDLIEGRLNDNASYQYKVWFSLKEKGLLLIEAYSKDILPHIKRVIATQVPVEVKNETGDMITGFADLICEWDDGRIVLLDHKTTSITFKNDAANSEEYGKQTALYFDLLKDKYKLDAVGFIVLEKKIRKKVPRARVYWTEFQVPKEELIQKTFKEFDEVCEAIKAEKYDCAYPKCNAYGKECCYRKFCQSGDKNMEGLVKLYDK